jgi:hypothetical protein
MQPPVVWPSARAWWVAPDGTRHTGLIHASPGAVAGSTVVVWVTRSGELAAPSLGRKQVMGWVIVAGLAAPLALGTVLLCAGLVARCLLDWQRMKAWDAEWQVIGPRWTSRR